MRRFPKKGEGDIPFLILLILNSFLTFVESYPTCDCDDKAVHYFSSAYIFASSEKQQDIQSYSALWIEDQEDAQQAARLKGRLHFVWNYLASDVLIHGTWVVLNQFNLFSDTDPFTASLKIAFLMMHVLAILWLLWVNRKDRFLKMGCLLALSLTAFGNIPITFLADLPMSDMLPYIYVPRGSATILGLAALIACARRDYGSVAVTCFILILWHLGLSAILIPLIVLTLGLCLQRDKKSTRPIQFLFQLLSKIIAILLGIIAFILSRFEPHSIIPLLIPFFGGLWIKWVNKKEVHPLVLHFAEALCWFLFVSQAFSLVMSLPAVTQYLGQLTQLPLVSEIGLRLTGIRYLCAMTLLLIGLIYLLERIIIHYFRSHSFQAILKKGMLYAATIWLLGFQVLNDHHVSERIHLFLSNECPISNGVPLNKESLASLRNDDDVRFFVSLANYLLN